MLSHILHFFPDWNEEEEEEELKAIENERKEKLETDAIVLQVKQIFIFLSFSSLLLLRGVRITKLVKFQNSKFTFIFSTC